VQSALILSRMKKSLKRSLIIIALVLVGCVVFLVWLAFRPDDPLAGSISDTAGSMFEVNVEKPRMDRALFGILPTKVEAKLFGVDELRFGHASRGAKIGNVGPDRIELGAEGWDLRIETNGQGAIAPGTRLVFPIEIAEKQWTLRCRPADLAVGFLDATKRAGSEGFDGRFVVELAKCEDAKTGKILDMEAGANPGHAWPASPLTLRGTFKGLHTHPSLEPIAP
jgi:hypothetical protein